MANQLVRDLISTLPWTMRESVEGYVGAVAAARPEIERDAGTKLSSNTINTFLFLVAVRRIWATVNSQQWIVSNSVVAAESRGLSGFQAGSERYSRGAAAVVEVRDLHFKFQKLLIELDIEQFVTTSSLADLLRAVARADS